MLGGLRIWWFKVVTGKKSFPTNTKDLHSRFWDVPLTWLCFVDYNLAPLLPTLSFMHDLLMRLLEIKIFGVICIQRSSGSVLTWWESWTILMMVHYLTENVCHFRYLTLLANVSTERIEQLWRKLKWFKTFPNHLGSLVNYLSFRRRWVYLMLSDSPKLVGNRESRVQVGSGESKRLELIELGKSQRIWQVPASFDVQCHQIQ